MVAREQKEISRICKAMGGEGRGVASSLEKSGGRNGISFTSPLFLLHLPELFGTIHSVTTYDRIIPLDEAKRKTIEEGFKEFGARYTAHFSHWLPRGTMIYDRFFCGKSPLQDPLRGHPASQPHLPTAKGAALAEGGVVNEHHGIGQKLGCFMPEQFGSAWPVLQNLKKMLDPNNIMNPGTNSKSVRGAKDPRGQGFEHN